MIAIIDCIGNNLSSIVSSLNRLGIESKLTHDPGEIGTSSHVILPGVGTATTAMKRLRDYDLIHILRSLTQPVLGICIGMQILFELSEEGNEMCLGLIPGKIKKIISNDSNQIILPHMGWNTVKSVQDNSLMEELDDNSYFYFVHSYIADVNKYTLATTRYGENFPSIVKYLNFYGVQFHPERSGSTGSKLLSNFVRLS